MDPTPYVSNNRKVPTPCVCPQCGSLVNLWYRSDTGRPVMLECLHKDWRMDLTIPRRRKPGAANSQEELL